MPMTSMYMVVSHWLTLSGVPKLAWTPLSMEFMAVCVRPPSAAVSVTIANIAYVRRRSMAISLWRRARSGCPTSR